MKPTLFNLSKGYIHSYEQDGKQVRLWEENGTFTVEFSLTNFPEPQRSFSTLSAAIATFQWFTKSIKHGYL